MFKCIDLDFFYILKLWTSFKQDLYQPTSLLEKKGLQAISLASEHYENEYKMRIMI